MSSAASSVVSATTNHVACAPLTTDGYAAGDLEAVTLLRVADGTTVEMVAPADLRAGFQFTAQLDGQPIQVEVVRIFFALDLSSDYACRRLMFKFDLMHSALL